MSDYLFISQSTTLVLTMSLPRGEIIVSSIDEYHSLVSAADIDFTHISSPLITLHYSAGLPDFLSDFITETSYVISHPTCYPRSFLSSSSTCHHVVRHMFLQSYDCTAASWEHYNLLELKVSAPMLCPWLDVTLAFGSRCLRETFMLRSAV